MDTQQNYNRTLSDTISKNSNLITFLHRVLPPSRNAVCNAVPHDASEYVDEDGLDLLVPIQQLEGLLHLAFCGPPTHIQEIRRVPSLQLMDTKGHREKRLG